MAIITIDGKPGSGKTLYAVNHLVKNHYKKIGGIYEKSHKHILISNIDELELPHDDLNTVLESAGGIKVFFSREYQEKLFHEKGAMIYIIDEAQFLFDRKFYDKEVFNWFQYHRHYGQSIYLITQNANNLPKEIQYCSEYIIRALPRSRSLFNKHFHYNFIADSDTIGTDKILASKELFSLYSSMKADTIEKTKRPFIKVALMNLSFAAIAMGLGGYFIKYKFTHLGPQENVAQASVSSVSVVSSVPSKSSAGVQVSPWTTTGKSPVSPDVSDSFFSWKKVSSVTLRNKVTILYNGVYSMDDFPFKLKFVNGWFYAFVPENKTEES